MLSAARKQLALFVLQKEGMASTRYYRWQSVFDVLIKNNNKYANARTTE
jgi:hypothetical protein